MLTEKQLREAFTESFSKQAEEEMDRNMWAYMRAANRLAKKPEYKDDAGTYEAWRQWTPVPGAVIGAMLGVGVGGLATLSSSEVAKAIALLGGGLAGGLGGSYLSKRILDPYVDKAYGREEKLKEMFGEDYKQKRRSYLGTLGMHMGLPT